MFVLEFEKPLFEFAYDTPHWAPLFALAPTFSSSTVCCLFNPRRLRAVEVGGAVRRGQDFIFVEVLAWEIFALA